MSKHYENKEELKLQNKVMEMLRAKGIMTFNISTANMSNFPDILAFHKGMFICIELKADEKSVVRQGQLKMLKALGEEGGICLLAWSLEQIEKLLIALEFELVICDGKCLTLKEYRLKELEIIESRIEEFV